MAKKAKQNAAITVSNGNVPTLKVEPDKNGVARIPMTRIGKTGAGNGKYLPVAIVEAGHTSTRGFVEVGGVSFPAVSYVYGETDSETFTRLIGVEGFDAPSSVPADLSEIVAQAVAAALAAAGK